MSDCFRSGLSRNYCHILRRPPTACNQGPVSISAKTSYRKISWSLEATRLVVNIIASLWNLTDTSAALLPKCLSNFRAIGQFQIQISRLRDFTISYEKTSFLILRQGPGISSIRSDRGSASRGFNKAGNIALMECGSIFALRYTRFAELNVFDVCWYD